MTEIVLQEFDTQLTLRGLFSVYEQFKNQGNTGAKAYALVEQFCVDRRLALHYSNYDSFKDAYYSFIRKQQRKNKVRNPN